MTARVFDCIVLGGGHAGAEAAHAAARMGAKTALVTLSRDTIAQMSCNPAIGGLAKGQIVREVDALGGLMGLAADATGIQFRMLNRSKGPAVQSPRAQTDKLRYAAWIRQALEATPNLTMIEAMVDDLVVEGGRVRAVVCEDGTVHRTGVVVLAAGTFLRGLMHIGQEQFPGGRRSEPSAERLSGCLERLGLTVKRLKTGTPPRLDASTVDLEGLEIQHGDPEPVPFSFLNDAISRAQIPCWITWTNEQIHQLLRDNLDRAPLYTGQIRSVGPRYCPSIESKILRFADKPRHQVFLEPEDQAVTTLYCNGISTSVPRDVQHRMLELMPGTAKARIVHYAYAVEYDYCPPLQLNQNLETKAVEGLFLAGQVNGTSGYEEAAGQGILAGINAARKLQGHEPLVLGRSQAYLGVLVDDLLTKEIDEPYRMFTSRAEYRLSLRADNADRRLTALGRSLGLVDDARWARFQKKQAEMDDLRALLHRTRDSQGSLWDQLRRPQSDLASRLPSDPVVARFGKDVMEAVLTDAKYEGYLAKQERLVANLQSLERRHIPVDLDYRAIRHLSTEAKEKLSLFKPQTLAQAARIAGVTPADITVLQVHLKRLQEDKRMGAGPQNTERRTRGSG
ncbi:MAG: tRNA uridine-5-carboxymethylaminomethyl(34) synthesis enzyme MnmG [Phycisphaerae bacterium]|nr:tRNA uridine-5-carboxymethylaminomethyl(34) synthesis enzyme MnmG [Phycisphaerae bacterium]